MTKHHTNKSGHSAAAIGVAVGASILLGGNPAAARDKALIADHTTTDISRIPAAAIARARETLKIAYGHTSHGSQIVAGMEALKQRNPELYAFGRQEAPGNLSFWDTTPGGDLGNPDRTTWAERTRELLNGRGRDRNVIVWSWCGQAGTASEAQMQTYLDLMDGLEKDFPEVTFIYMTGHLDGGGKDGNLHQRNEQIRDFCRKNNKVLFDFADIESFDPDGKVNFIELHANDGCSYRRNGTRGNWADEWLAANPDHQFALPASAAHSRPLNAALKGQAFWHLLARLAGWDGSSSQ